MDRAHGQQKRATCFATLLQNELNSDAARFTTDEFFFAIIENLSECQPEEMLSSDYFLLS